MTCVPLTNATTDGPWELPAIGPVTALSAVLVRPDGYVAWGGEGSAEGLTAALATWFGAAGMATSPPLPAAEGMAP
jgi:3-(3-hydroxy-phenyl)propionate hydroxylase